jgi:hypothetical protein
MINSYASYVHYFRQIAENHKDINDFVVGNSERIISQERQDLEYPVLWLEDPEINFRFQDDLKTVFSGSLVILINSKPDDWQGQDLIMERTFQIARAIVARMVDDSQADNFFELDASRVQLDPIQTYTHAADHGWRIDFSITELSSACLTGCVWKREESIPAVGFNWKIEDDLLTLEDLTHPELEYTIEIRSTPAGPILLSPEEFENIDISTLPAEFYIYLSSTYQTVQINASAHAFRTVGCGTSVPYKLK